jgi:hypothetical protein
MFRRLAVLIGAAPLILAITLPSGGASGAPAVSPRVIPDSSLSAMFATVGGATPLATDRTVAHFATSTLDPHNGVTYGYNMVGANPASCSGTACSTTVEADIVPINVNLDGWSFTASGGVTSAVLASPLFASNDYSSTPNATAPGNPSGTPPTSLVEGPGGPLLPAEAGVQLQLEDATMRAQFNQEGTSPYHLMLSPVVEPTVTINVPASQGTLLQSGRGVVFADINISWWSSQINNLESQAAPSNLAIYLTNNVFNYEGHNVNNCCVLGFHGAKARSSNGNGNAKVQTFAWASYVSPGLYSRANGGTDWALQDIHALSHEIAEWADDPFVNNAVEPWLTPTAPQYGCSNLLETGDPVVGIGFSMGTNAFEQGSNPNGTQSADGTYHPEDEVFMPWFLRLNPSTSAPAQTSSGGRYTLMGDLNPFSGFRAPATGC